MNKLRLFIASLMCSFLSLAQETKVTILSEDSNSQDQVVFLACEAYNLAINEIYSNNWGIYPNPNN